MPFADSPIDWEALGLFQKTEDSTEDQVLPEFTAEPLKFHRTPGEKDLHITEWQDENKWVDQV